MSACSHRPVRRAVPPPHRRPRGPAVAGRPARPERPAGAPPARPRLRQLVEPHIPPRHPLKVALGCPCCFLARLFRFAVLRRWAEVRLPPNPPHQTACRAVGWTSEWPARRLVSDEREPRLMPWTLTADRDDACWGWSRKARQVTWAKKHNGGRYSNRLRHTISQIGGFERGRYAAGGTSPTSSPPTSPRTTAGSRSAVRMHRCGQVEHADLNAARNIHNLAAGQAVHCTRSHLRAARPSSRMREPFGSVA